MKKGKIQSNCHRWKLRQAVFRVGVLWVVLAPLLIIEIVFRLWVPDPGMGQNDPYVSFAGLQPLFVLNVNGTTFNTAKERLHYFCPQSFPASKAKDTFRIFCIGGSTVQGRPYSVETSFSTWLKLNLQAICPDKNIEMINCGGISYASYRLAPILQELLGYESDLFILYTGQNEFLEERTYRRLRRMPRSLIRLHRSLLWLRTYRVANHYLHAQRDQKQVKTKLPPEVNPKLDLEAGVQTYQRDLPGQQSIIEHFRYNVEHMVRLTRQENIPIVLMNPVSNLEDCPPFKSEFRADLSVQDRNRINTLWERARHWETTDPWGKLRLLEQAIALDQTHAGLLFQAGKSAVLTGNQKRARQWFIQAKEQDICPLRMLEPMHDIVKQIAAQNAVPLVDVRHLIEQQSDGHIPGSQWLLDHVHPTIDGHQLIADAIIDTLADMQFIHCPSDWNNQRATLWEDHLTSLEEGYYQEGFVHLKMLEAWARRRGGE
ncbi:SGNH/GDSL hydrolase family protein [Planctomycetota bacterium]